MKLERTKQKILEFVNSQDQLEPDCDFKLDGDSVTILSLINGILQQQYLTLERLERLEGLIKNVLREIVLEPVSGHLARKLSVVMKEQDLLLKYKPYAVKAASPFGYSIFLQREREGFSYQNHLSHKTEVFHILDVLPGGFVFLCHYEDWIKHYDKKTFEDWLAGGSHAFFDRCRFVPEPGDVFVISELGIVHTVIGCVLEEFATASTDMVQRLHDQNDRDKIPQFSVAKTQERLKRLKLPVSCRRVDMLAGDAISWNLIPPKCYEWGRSFVFTDSFVKAAHVEVNPYSCLPSVADPLRLTVIRIFEGRSLLRLLDDGEKEAGQFVTPIELNAGELTVIPPGVHFEIKNCSEQALSLSEHRIEPSVALA